MNTIPPDRVWRRLVTAARGAVPAEPASVEAPPWLARRVVSLWQHRCHVTVRTSWERASRQGLAFAVVVMLASMLIHARSLTPTPPWEILTTESVLSSVLPP